jgi:hypothetical protein
MPSKKKKKLSLKKAAEELTKIAEKHLSVLPPEEQDIRVAAFSRTTYRRGIASKSSSTECTQVYPVAAKGHE